MIHNESSYTEMFKEEKNKHLCTFPLCSFLKKMISVYRVSPSDPSPAVLSVYYLRAQGRLLCLNCCLVYMLCYRLYYCHLDTYFYEWCDLGYNFIFYYLGDSLLSTTNSISWDFSGAETLCSQCRGPRVGTWSGNQIPQATLKHSHATTNDPGCSK